MTKKVLRITIVCGVAAMSAFAIGATHVTMIESILATPIEDVQATSASEQQRVFSTLDAIEPIHERSEGLWIDATVTTAPSPYDFEGLRVPTLILTGWAMSRS